MRNTYTSLCKTLVAAGTLAAFGLELPAAANPSLTYTNTAGETVYDEDSLGIFILDNSASNVVFDTGTKSAYTKDTYLNSGLFSNVTINATGNETEARITSKASITGNISVNGKTGYFANYGGTIASGTKINLNDGTFEFMGTGTQIWNISTAETGPAFALISGTGTATIRNTTIYGVPTSSWLRLNFKSMELLEKTKTLTLVDSKGVKTTSRSFMGIEITVDGWSQYNYTATLDWNPDSVNFGKITIINPYIPEPSAFGLLAGTFALGFAVSRRRRKA